LREDLSVVVLCVLSVPLCVLCVKAVRRDLNAEDAENH